MRMRISYELRGVSFEWDSEKADANIQKHGVSFPTACEAFFDPFVRIIEPAPQLNPAKPPLAIPKANNSSMSYT